MSPDLVNSHVLSLLSPACDCDPVGSEGGGLCESATGQCICKDNVEGQRCDRCKYSFYGLRENDPAGCQSRPCMEFLPPVM